MLHLRRHATRRFEGLVPAAPSASDFIANTNPEREANPGIRHQHAGLRLLVILLWASVSLMAGATSAQDHEVIEVLEDAHPFYTDYADGFGFAFGNDPGSFCLDLKHNCEDTCHYQHAQGILGIYNPAYIGCVYGCNMGYDTCVRNAPKPRQPQPPAEIPADPICFSNRIACEDACWDMYGGGWLPGIWDPQFVACVYECGLIYAECTQIGYTMPDGTISHEQPTPDVMSPWFGYCGPTACANLTSMNCGYDVPPMEFDEECFGLNPGTLPNDLCDALESWPENGDWEVCSENSSLDDLAANLPAAALLDWDGQGGLHWVTVVDINQGPPCTVTFNHWGRQQVMNCSDFTNRWSLNCSCVAQVCVGDRILNPYTYVCEVPSPSPAPSPIPTPAPTPWR
jgi:hypothetical protein